MVSPSRSSVLACSAGGRQESWKAEFSSAPEGTTTVPTRLARWQSRLLRMGTSVPSASCWVLHMAVVVLVLRVRAGEQDPGLAAPAQQVPNEELAAIVPVRSQQGGGQLGLDALHASTILVWPLPMTGTLSVQPVERSVAHTVQIHSPAANSPLWETRAISKYPGVSSSRHWPTNIGTSRRGNPLGLVWLIRRPTKMRRNSRRLRSPVAVLAELSNSRVSPVGDRQHPRSR